MGNCMSRGFGVSDNGEKTEEMMSNTMMGRGLELPDDYSTYGVTARPRGYRNRREPCDYYNNNNVGAAEVFPRYNSGGVWKVNLVISSEQLSQILSEEGRTEALIESVRTAAHCAPAGASSVSTLRFSRHKLNGHHDGYIAGIP